MHNSNFLEESSWRLDAVWYSALHGNGLGFGGQVYRTKDKGVDIGRHSAHSNDQQAHLDRGRNDDPFSSMLSLLFKMIVVMR